MNGAAAVLGVGDGVAVGVGADHGGGNETENVATQPGVSGLDLSELRCNLLPEGLVT